MRAGVHRPTSTFPSDNSPICPDCGTREALESIGVGREEQDKILGIIHEKYEGEE